MVSLLCPETTDLGRLDRCGLRSRVVLTSPCRQLAMVLEATSMQQRRHQVCGRRQLGLPEPVGLLERSLGRWELGKELSVQRGRGGSIS